MENRVRRITPFLWFDDKAEEAAIFYTSIFDNSRIVTVTRCDREAAAATRRPEGSAMTVAFELDGQSFIVVRSAGEMGHLYGSVSTRDISDLITAGGFSVDRNQVALKAPISFPSAVRSVPPRRSACPFGSVTVATMLRGAPSSSVVTLVSSFLICGGPRGRSHRERDESRSPAERASRRRPSTCLVYFLHL